MDDEPQTSAQKLENLMARVAMKDRAAFQDLYSATSAKLFGVVLRVLGNRAEAEEVLQEAYIRIWNNADRFAANQYSPMTWLITVARNLAIDRLRGRKSANVDIDDLPELADSAPTPEGLAVAASEARRLDDCLGALDTDRAAAVRGAYMNGDTYADLAERHDVPLNTMRTWLRRSLIALKECLSQ